MHKQLDKKVYCGENFKQVTKDCFDQTKSTIISFVNPFSYLEVLKNDELIKKIDYFFSDGAMLCMFHRLFYYKIKRASFDFSSIAHYFLHEITTKNLKVAIIGAKSEEIDLAINNLMSLYPKMNIVYSRDGYIKDDTEFLRNLNRTCPEVIILGMGSPKQEEMAIYIKGLIENPTTIITCGGFLTQTAIKLDYYHPLIKKFGLRWLQRIMLHSHVRKRVLIDYPKFIFIYLKKHMFK
jgi:N-acetylglucosaminyldiphosphoundecaprenol N-acetyl-beta-D-mannosaminyltransferase